MTPKFHQGERVTFVNPLTGKPLGGEGVVLRAGTCSKLFLVARNSAKPAWFGRGELRRKE